MKHRSTGVFILLAAALFAVPQASQELSALKNSLGERVRAEVLHAFLNLHTQDTVKVAAPRQREALVAACPSTPAPGAHAAPKNKKDGGQAATGRRAAGGEVAMLVPPSAGFIGGVFEIPGVEKSLEFAGRPGKGEQLIPLGEVAMIIPPGVGVNVPKKSASHRAESPAKSHAGREAKAAESQNHFSYVAARFEGRDWEKNGEELSRQLQAALRGAAEIRAVGEETRVKQLKLKVQAKAGVTPQPRASSSFPAPAQAFTQAVFAYTPVGE